MFSRIGSPSVYEFVTKGDKTWLWDTVLTLADKEDGFNDGPVDYEISENKIM